MAAARSFLSSPRRRRRLAWLLAVVAGVAAVAILVIADPGRNSHARRTAPSVPGFGVTTTQAPFSTTISQAEERARERAEATVRPLAAAFLGAMITGRGLARAHVLLAPSLQHGSVADWQLGRHLPVSLGKSSTVGSETVAYSGASEVGLVVSIDRPGETDSRLVALRFDRHDRWLIEYIHQGRASARIDASNYAPPGFLPGSHRETAGTWLILLGGLAGVIALVALADWMISRRRSITS